MRQKGTYVENLTEVVLRDWNHLKGLISVCEGSILVSCCALNYCSWCLSVVSFVHYVIATAQRRTGETFLNEKSSRSHQILRLVCPLLVYVDQLYGSMLFS